MRVFPLFRSGAVLPSGRAFAVWGEAAPGSRIRLKLAGQSLEGSAEADGSWRIKVPALPPGEGYTLELSCGKERLLYEDIALGKVFLLSGQSNMQLPVSRCTDAMPPFFEGLEDSRIRELRLPLAPSFDKENRRWPEPSEWKSLSALTMPEFGALGLAFAAAYLDDHDLPIGLVNCSVGGTTAESWLPLEDLADRPDLTDVFYKWAAEAERKAADEAYAKALQAWHEKALAAEVPEDAFEAFGEDIFPDMLFETKYKDFHGVLWLRCRFELTPEEAASRSARLELGCLFHEDITYLNGREVGRTDYQYPPRRYDLPPGILRAGENEVLVRLLVPFGTGGAVPGKFYGLILDEATVPLGGDIWEIAPGPELPLLGDPKFWDRIAGSNYYAYLQPLKGFPFTAALWYQGESNDQNPEDYAEHFKRLIRRFRQDFGKKLPFIYVQLTRYDDPFRGVPEDSWAMIREAQRQALALNDTAMVVSLDVGEANDLHPQDKWSLGYRCYLAYKAMHAGHSDYGLSPELSSWFRDGRKLRLYFRYAASGLWTDGDFEKAFVYRDQAGNKRAAEILELSDNYIDLALPDGIGDDELKTYQLLFLYENNPPYAYLRNGDGLPASPFLIDLDEDGSA